MFYLISDDQTWSSYPGSPNFAMPGIPCGSRTCDFISADGTLMLNQKLQHLPIHAQTDHPVQQHQGGHTPRGKVDRPTLKPLCDQEGEGWEFFRYECVNYKASMGIIGGSVSSLVQGAGSWWKSLRRTSRSPSQGSRRPT